MIIKHYKYHACTFTAHIVKGNKSNKKLEFIFSYNNIIDNNFVSIITANAEQYK